MTSGLPLDRHAVAFALAVMSIATGCSAARTDLVEPGPRDVAAAVRPVAPSKATPPKASSPRAGAVNAEPERRAPASGETARAVTPGPVAPGQAALQGPLAPVWHVGDQWAFRWESGEGQGDYVWTVDRIDTLDGVEQYVIRTGPREIFFRRSDLATSQETTGSTIDRRNSPPRLAFSWPLNTGTAWRQRYTEDSAGRAGAERNIAWKVESEEDIRVEAGTFHALRIVARHAPTPAIMYEMWYAPEVKQWVRLKEHFPAGIRYRELTAFSLRS